MIRFSPETFRDPGKSNTIYTLDIETTSLFRFPDGSYRCFDYSKPPEFYKGCDKISIPYIWMFGVNDTVYYGREFSELETVFKLISAEKKKIVFVHNLSFEFTFLQDIFDSYTIDNMIARTVRKPIAFNVAELNLQFRCTYMLTNLSLARAAERYTDVRKKSGDLDYNKIRTPRTPMTETELGYCEYDIITLYNIVRYFRQTYKRLSWIPYTQTGEVRKAFRKRIDYGYICRIQKRVPDDVMYLRLNKAFQGGMTHPNTLYTGRTMEGVPSFDIASSYPTIMMLPIFAKGQFRRIKSDIADKLNRKNWCILYRVRYYGLRSKLLNKYILGSKIVKQPDETRAGNEHKRYFDNGRLVRAEGCTELYLTEIDKDIIDQAYKCDRCEVVEAYAAVKGYLPKELITFVLELYANKTKLKGVAGQEDFYMKQKQMLNSCFGAACTNLLKAGVEYKAGEWILPDLTPDYVHEKLEGLRNSKSNCFLYQWAPWITAGARARLWDVISHFDTDIIYYDTDSIKCLDKPEIERYLDQKNTEIKEQLLTTCEHFGIDPDMMAPLDPEGLPHPLGFWEKEYKSYAVKFRTLGAKRYCYQTRDGKLHTVVSGVGKNGPAALKGDIENFTDGLIFDYDTAGKLASYYSKEDQTRACIIDYTGRMYINKQRHGVVLQPTTYNMSTTEAYAAYMEELQNGFRKGEWLT